MNCRSCGVDVTGKRFCTNCGTATPLGTAGPFAPPGATQTQSPPVPPPGYAAQPSGKRIPAGICGILLGGLGIHKFLLGYTTAGIIMLVIGLFSCGVASAVIGLIEGVIYLTKSDQEFDATYVAGKKEWF
jgi:TM2 domain-containing membrane protein YozV